jgi:hypothetical protein
MHALNIYDSGDHDMCVPFTGSEAWTRSLGYKIVDEWRSWDSNDQVAGYINFSPTISIPTQKIIVLISFIKFGNYYNVWNDKYMRILTCVFN